MHTPPGRRFPLLGLVAAIAFGCAAARSASAQATSDVDQRDAPEVVRLDLRGTHHVDGTDLQRSIAADVSRCKSILLKPFCLLSHSGLWWHIAYLNRAELPRDVLRIKVYYFKRGYRQTQVDTSIVRSGRGVHVAFDITEGPVTVTRVVRVEGAQPALTDKEIRAAVAIRSAQPYSLLAIDTTVVTLRQALFNKGYADAQVKSTTTVDDSAHVGEVRYDVDPKWHAVVAGIHISGNKKVSERTILHSLVFKPGDPYTLREVNRSQRNLYESNLFRRAAIQTASADSAKQIEINVREAPLRDFRTSIGFNTIDFFQVEQQFTQYNFLGGGRRLALRGALGNLLAPQLNGVGIFQAAQEPTTPDDHTKYLAPTFEVSAELSQPWFRSPLNSLGLSLFAHRRSAPAIFVDEGYGANASLTHQVMDHAPLTVSYRYEESRVQASDVYFCQDYGVCDVTTTLPLRQWRKLSPISVSFFADEGDDPVKPRTGYVARADIEHANSYTLSDFHYVRASAEYARYFPVGKGMTLAAHVRSGFVRSLASTASAIGLDSATGSEIIHPRKRFYSGGSQSVRGYGENQLGPRILTIDPTVLAANGCTTTTTTVTCPQSAIDAISSTSFQPRPLGGTALAEANVELRFPLDNVLTNLGGAVFLDGGFVGQGALKDVGKGKGAITPGFGIRYYTSAGAIRLDLGIRPTLVEPLQVVTELDDNGQRRIVTVTNPSSGTPITKQYDPVSGRSGIFSVLDRLTLHLSIGQAF